MGHLSRGCQSESIRGFGLWFGAFEENLRKQGFTLDIVRKQGQFCVGYLNKLYLCGSAFSTSVPQELLKRAILNYLVRDTDLFPLRQSNKKMTTANTTTVIWCE